jgi:hypothetical protein
MADKDDDLLRKAAERYRGPTAIELLNQSGQRIRENQRQQRANAQAQAAGLKAVRDLGGQANVGRIIAEGSDEERKALRARLGDDLYAAADPTPRTSTSGVLPTSSEPSGAPSANEPVTTRPNRPVFDNMREAITKAMAARGQASLNQLGALAQVQPQPIKPLNPVEAAQKQYLEGIDATYGPAIAQAQTDGNFETAADLYARRNAELVKLFDPDAAYLQGLDED